MDLSLYLHLPYCRARCPYCDFAISTDPVSDRLVEALEREMAPWKGRRIRTLHLGGGTPSLLPPASLERLMASVRAHFELLPGAEVAIECNPSDAASFGAYPAMGFNRLSLGVQSFDERELEYLGRDHDVPKSLRAAEAARKAGFRNLSLDLIYGLPGQKLPGWRRTLEKALSLRPEHVSVYALTLTGSKTLLGPPLPAEEASAAMALEAIEVLEGAGIRQYEISNFARPGFESRHNLAYWTFQPYVGMGPGAHSYLPPKRSSNVAQTGEYLARVLAGKGPKGAEETLTPQQMLVERIFLGLRLMQGLEPKHLPEEAGEEVEALASEGLLERTPEGRWALTRKGRIVADAVTARIVRTLPDSKELEMTGA